MHVCPAKLQTSCTPLDGPNSLHYLWQCVDYNLVLLLDRFHFSWQSSIRFREGAEALLPVSVDGVHRCRLGYYVCSVKFCIHPDGFWGRTWEWVWWLWLRKLKSWHSNNAQDLDKRRLAIQSYCFIDFIVAAWNQCSLKNNVDNVDLQILWQPHSALNYICSQYMSAEVNYPRGFIKLFNLEVLGDLSLSVCKPGNKLAVLCEEKWGIRRTASKQSQATFHGSLHTLLTLQLLCIRLHTIGHKLSCANVIVCVLRLASSLHFLISHDYPDIIIRTSTESRPSGAWSI